MQPVMFEIIGAFSVSWYAKTVIYFLCLPEISGSGRKKSYFGALTNYWKSDIVVLATDIRTESEQPKMKKRCYIYTRVFTAAQVEGYSLEAQTERLREYADYRELEIAGEYCDAGKSGRSIKGRPAFQQMLDDIVCEKDGISFVLVFKLSRFGRNAADVLKSMQLLTDCEVDLVCVEDVIVVDGSHEPLVTPEQWHFVRMKRERHKGRSKKTEEPERISLLSGLVKCPKCGSGMIAKKNKSINHNHGGYYKTLYYYGCNNNRKCNGRVCDFSHTYNQEKVDGAVFEIVSGLTMLPVFRERVLHHLGNTDVMDRLETELKKLRKTIRSEEMKKRKLGEDLDNLDFLDDDYDKDYEKLQGEIDRVYDRIEKAEAEMERKMKKLSAAKQGTQAADRIKRLLEHMGKLYGHMSCEERRKMYRFFIERIEVYPKHPDGKIIKSIVFRFPVFYGEEDVKEDKAPDEQVVFTLDCGELGLTASEAKATYAQIRKYVSEKFGAMVSSLYIAQVKRKYGLDLGKNYNVSKKTNARVPVCPKDKEGFIVDALKHYKMLDTDVEMKEQGDL